MAEPMVNSKTWTMWRRAGLALAGAALLMPAAAFAQSRGNNAGPRPANIQRVNAQAGGPRGGNAPAPRAEAPATPAPRNAAPAPAPRASAPGAPKNQAAAPRPAGKGLAPSRMVKVDAERVSARPAPRAGAARGEEPRPRRVEVVRPAANAEVGNGSAARPRETTPPVSDKNIWPPEHAAKRNAAASASNVIRSSTSLSYGPAAKASNTGSLEAGRPRNITGITGVAQTGGRITAVRPRTLDIAPQEEEAPGGGGHPPRVDPPVSSSIGLGLSDRGRRDHDHDDDRWHDRDRRRDHDRWRHHRAPFYWGGWGSWGGFGWGGSSSWGFIGFGGGPWSGWGYSPYGAWCGPRGYSYRPYWSYAYAPSCGDSFSAWRVSWWDGCGWRSAWYTGALYSGPAWYRPWAGMTELCPGPGPGW